MKKYFVAVVILLSCITSFGQASIGDLRVTVRGKLQPIIKKDCFQCEMTETDSTISVLSKDSTALPALFIYHFTENKKCYKEESIAHCKPCFDKYLATAPGKKEYEWVKVDDKHWVSKYPEKLILEITDDQKDYSFIIYRMNWDKGLYSKLIAP
ncbi:MAG: hypothetical protein C4329_13510 [Chitinophagaceae bacterium]